MGILLIFLGLLSVYMIKDLFNRNIIIGLSFAFLQIYIYLPAVARYNDSALVDLVSYITVSNVSTVYEYLFFCYAQSIFLFVLLKKLTSQIEYIVCKPNILHVTFIKRNINVYNTIQICVGLYLMYNMLQSYSYMSYYNQGVVKSNTIWLILLEYSFIFYLINFWLYHEEKRVMPALFGLLIAIPACVTLFKIGNRGIAMPALLGYMYLIMSKRNIRIDIKQIKNIILVALLILISIGLSQFVRINRGADSDSHEFSFSMISNFFDVNVILFQDYTVPGNSLMYCMQHQIIDPLFVILSNIGNGIFFLDYPTIASDISKRINTGEVFGVGGFFPVEGYYLCGYFGIIIMPIIVCAFYRLYFKYLMTGRDRRYDFFIGFLLCTFLSLNIARGQSYFLFKILYMYILPCCVLYRLAFGSKNT